MGRWYQNVLSGKQVEVKTLDEDDFYVENAANWARIPTPPGKAEDAAEPETVTKAEASEAGRVLEVRKEQIAEAPMKKQARKR